MDCWRSQHHICKEIMIWIGFKFFQLFYVKDGITAPLPAPLVYLQIITEHNKVIFRLTQLIKVIIDKLLPDVMLVSKFN